MTEQEQPRTGWSVFASGRSQNPDVIARLRDGLAELEAHPAAGVQAATVKATDTGWILEAHGHGDDPNVHAQVRDHVQRLISAPGTAVGSSDFNSPHAAAQNFQTLPPLGQDDDAGAGGGESRAYR